MHILNVCLKYFIVLFINYISFKLIKRKILVETESRLLAFRGLEVWGQGQILMGIVLPFGG